MDFILEVIGFNIEGCMAAQAAGADRIELCDNPADGGTTPSYGFIKSATEELQIEVYPIIRPRGGDFLYNEEEFEMMKADVQVCVDLGCDGVVIGILNADGTVDKERCRQLVELAYPLGVTFHRAFDRVVDPMQAMEDIIEIGCERILTSGQKPNAMAELIAKLIEQAKDRIIIMPGSGVRSENIIELATRTGAVEFHTSARTTVESRMEYINKEMKESLRSVAVDDEEIKRITTLLTGHQHKE
jgi:copper homeostasis protein